MEPHMPAPQSTKVCNADQVEPFMLYRAARARNWRIRAPQLSRETGVSLPRTYEIIRERRWTLKPDMPAQSGDPLPLTAEFV
jgi:hypothetical protein